MSIKNLQDFTFYSRYANYKPEVERRETWKEAADRMFGMHEEYFKDILDSSEEFRNYFSFAKNMVLQKKVLGSQRALQFGGIATLSKHARIYNCVTSYADRPRFFQECMWMLLCGCGAGFSVQKHHVNKLPYVQPRTKGKKVYVIPDSIEGWADSIGVLLSSYWVKKNPFPEYAGYEVEFDYSQIRPKGSPISWGGIVPGPEGLQNSHIKIKNLIERRLDGTRRKLHPIDYYDVVMHSSDAVLSGGIRRSACLALFSPDDQEMASAKTGDWFVHNPQRGRSNNSAILVRDKTTRDQFSQLMQYVKDFGEPGFVFTENERVIPNPCVTGDTWVMTDKGPKQAIELLGKKFNAIVNGDTFSTSDKGMFETGIKDVFEIQTREGFKIKATGNHKFMLDDGEWKELKDIHPGDKIKLHQHKDLSWTGSGTEQEGWLLGSLIGDGCLSGSRALLDYWGDNSVDMTKQAICYIKNSNLASDKSKIKGCRQTSNVPKMRVGSAGLARFAEKYGIVKTNKEVTELVESGSSNFYKGFIRGYFDADGSVQGSQDKGVSIRLTSISINNLERIQRMLLRLGIYSKIYKCRRPEGYRSLPDGKGGRKDYWCNEIHELIISNSSIKIYADKIGFSDEEKTAKLQNKISNYKRSINKSGFTATFSSIRSVGNTTVYDCTVPGPHAFDGNGFYAHNCVEISMIPQLKLNKKLREQFAEEIKIQEDDQWLSGWQACNLCEMNGKKIKTEEDFYETCRAAAIIGTMQAAYTKFGYLGDVSEKIVQKEALLGVSMTGMMDSPEIIFNEEIQKKGAQVIIDVNEKLSKILGINPTARATCVKPAGHTSCVLGTASGIHPHHSKRYIRNVQANKMEYPAQYFMEKNPMAVEESVWSENKTDYCLSFLCEVPDGAKTKNQIGAIDLLKHVLLTQKNWVEYGTVPERCTDPSLRHNVSNTITVKPDEWREVEDFIYENKKWFAGISLLPMSGDKDYYQAPFVSVHNETELVREYGKASVFASGLIVDGLHAFGENLWAACDTALGRGEALPESMEKPIEPEEPHKNGYTQKEYLEKLLKYTKAYSEYLDNTKIFLKVDWVRRINQFSQKYFLKDILDLYDLSFDIEESLKGKFETLKAKICPNCKSVKDLIDYIHWLTLKRATYCLKDVNNWKRWCDLKREYVDIDWTEIKEPNFLVDVQNIGGEACSGGACEIGQAGMKIKELECEENREEELADAD